MSTSATTPATTPPSRATTRLPDNPFPGLRPFRADEEALFFGRESQVDAMVDRLAATRLLAVVGTSGSGKSSLVNCGLIPALHRGLMAGTGSAWRIASLRPGNRPLQALASSLATTLAGPDVLGGGPAATASGFTPAELIEAALRMGRRGLVTAFAQAQLDVRQHLLIVVDQFEELFRYRTLAGHSAREEATAFVDLLLEAATAPDAASIHIVLTMRSDFLGDCAQFFGLPEAINASQYLVPRLTREERRLAIAGPLGMVGTGIDPVLLTRLVNEVGDNPDQLSVLQHALHRTWACWAERGRQGVLTAAHYEAIGTMEQALDQHAERAWNALPDDTLREVCGRLFRAITDRTTDMRGTRRPTRFEALPAITGATPARLQIVIDALRDPQHAFLMPPAGQPITADTPIDIAHESLMRVWKRLQHWADDEARSAQIYRRLAETAELERAPEKSAGLLRPPDLDFVLAWRQREQPNPAWAARYRDGFAAAMEFLDRSARSFEAEQRADAALQTEQALQQQAQQRTHLRLKLAVLVSAVAIGAAALSSWALAQARQQRQIAEAASVLASQRQREAEAARQKAEDEAAAARRAVDAQDEQSRIYAQAALAPEVRQQIKAELDSQSLVYLQYPDPGLHDLAARLRKQLNLGGYSAPGVEAVRSAPTRPELRYFRAEDEPAADKLARLLRDWNLGTFKVSLVKGYDSQTRLRQMEIWFAAQDVGEIAALMQRLNGPAADDRRAAGQILQDRYTASPKAIEAALALLGPDRVGTLTPSGRINALYFLTRTAPLAWSTALQNAGRDVLARGRAAGAEVGPLARAELDHLERLLEAARSGAAAPPER